MNDEFRNYLRLILTQLDIIQVFVEDVVFTTIRIQSQQIYKLLYMRDNLSRDHPHKTQKSDNNTHVDAPNEDKGAL